MTFDKPTEHTRGQFTELLMYFSTKSKAVRTIVCDIALVSIYIVPSYSVEFAYMEDHK